MIKKKRRRKVITIVLPFVRNGLKALINHQYVAYGELNPIIVMSDIRGQ